MIHDGLVTENQLDEWVRGNTRTAQGVIVELVWRLVAASTPKPKERRFPLGDSIGQSGPDGVLFTELDYEPFVPQGRSYWEIGTGVGAGDKATSDYRDLTRATPAIVRSESTFVFVTPLSGRRDWPYNWKQDAQANWLEDRRLRNEWQGVRVIDGSKLIDWLHHFPAVELWLADSMGLPARQLQTPTQHWAVLSAIGDPPPLTPQVFLVNRSPACDKLNELFSGSILQVMLDTRFPHHIADFVAAYVAALDDDAKVEVVGRCLFVSGADGWNAMTNLSEPHVLVANFQIEETESVGTMVLQKARKGGHGVIFGGLPGGMPHPHRVSIPNPKRYQIREALENAGYNRERSRILAEKSNGDLSSLLRCLQNLSLMPEWAQGTDAAELAIAELLGGWREDFEADKEVVAELSKKNYGEWIGRMREISLRPGTPLIIHNSVWRFASRYEGWYALGPTIFDEHLDRLKQVAVSVLSVSDPQFELPPEERYAASIHSKVFDHSNPLRKGLGESLALLGSHPKALTSCSDGKAEETAALSVREILANADWALWGSLNNLLTSLAEADPREFLYAVENALNGDPCPFDTLLAQERPGVLGCNYVFGLLWALESLAWDPQHLTRVVLILGGLAGRDAGGSWANRPANSLSTILLPWFPQTCAPVIKRKIAVETLVNEQPDVAWKLLLSLLPQYREATSGSHKPVWRETIQDDWSEGVTPGEYREQIVIYAHLALSMAKTNLAKLTEIIDRLDDLPSPARRELLAHLGSEAVVSMPQCERVLLWTELVDVITKHRKHADAKWAMKKEQVDDIAVLAERLAPHSPNFRHRRLFSERDFDLHGDKSNYEAQRKELVKHRQRAIEEVFAAGGLQEVLEFARAVQSPWRVGIAFGVVAEEDTDRAVLPELLEAGDKSLLQFAEGFVCGRFRTLGWQWADKLDTTEWLPAQIGQFLAYLPFAPDTWERSTRLLGENDFLYWTRARANPYEAQKGLGVAVDSLIKHGRPYSAIRCLRQMQWDKQPLNSNQAVRALLATLEPVQDPAARDVDDLLEIVKTLQNAPDTNSDDLFRIEWSYLPLLDGHRDIYPKLLERRLAEDPVFFCEVIRAVFRSKSEELSVDEPTEQQENMATNAYRLLHHWKTPPGTRMDETLDGARLSPWLEQVKQACAASGHLEVAMTMVGHVLIHVPPDPDGLWIHHCVAEILNSSDAADMRDGFTTALLNSRGFHAFTAGREERELAEKYREQADQVEEHGYHRLADSLRELSASYERHAQRDASRDPYED